jgi:hypothetical protein
MNNHKLIMVIKNPIETTPNSLKLLRIGELTPLAISTLTPVSLRPEKEGSPRNYL